VALGYRDFRYMREDRDLDSIRQDPRFQPYLSSIRSRVAQQRKLLLAMRQSKLIPARPK